MTGKDIMDTINKAWITLIALTIILMFCSGTTLDSPTEDKIELPTCVDPTPSPEVSAVIQTTEPAPTPTPTPYLQFYTEDEVVMVAKVLYDECRGVTSDTEKACVVWAICNRVDAGYGETISQVVTAKGQFAYRSNAPVLDELYELAEDVLHRWNLERNGEDDVGRVLPCDYYWYSGDGKHNYFRNDYQGYAQFWDYSLDSPYEN